jgi:hypothetical protein
LIDGDAKWLGGRKVRVAGKHLTQLRELSTALELWLPGRNDFPRLVYFALYDPKIWRASGRRPINIPGGVSYR